MLGKKFGSDAGGGEFKPWHYGKRVAGRAESTFVWFIFEKCTKKRNKSLTLHTEHHLNPLGNSMQFTVFTAVSSLIKLVKANDNEA